MKRLIFTILTCFFLFNLSAQEIAVNLTINTPKLQTADPAIFTNMEGAINEFFANNRWTEDFYENEERINVNINMTITEEFSQREFGAEMTILASRPVYKSDYESVIFNHIDRDVKIVYEQNQPIQYNQGNYNDNLTSILSFYAYIIMGLDADTFSPMGGEDHFKTAQEIVNLVPQSVASAVKGWTSTDNNRNRYWLVENLLTPRVQPMRQALYDYHRLGLDKMHKEPNLGRVLMLESLEKIASVDRNYPNSMIIQLFSNAKASEILSVFIQAPPVEKNKAADIMTRLDAANARKFQKLRG